MSNFKKSLIWQASWLALALPCIAAAQDTTEVIVTVTREPLPLSRIGQSVDVLSARDIQSYQSLFIADLLTHTTDLSLTRNGGPGEAVSATIRGAGADHSLYLLDGIALNDPSQVGGGTNLGLLATDDAARIEVLRGPLSTLWGSGALGGVVSITTRQPSRPLESDLSLEGFDRYGSARLGLGGKSGKLDWRLFAGGQNDQGVSAYDGGTEKDGFTQTSFGGSAAYAIGSTTLKALSFNTHSRNDFDGFPPPLYVFADTGDFGKTDTSLNAVSVSNRFTGGEQALTLSYTQAQRHDYNPDATLNFIARGRMASADYHLAINLAGLRWLGGVKTERDEMRVAAPSVFDPDPVPLDKSATLSSLYGQVSHDFAGGASVAVSARHDQASSFGGEDIAQAAVVIPAGQHLRFHASAGQGVKVPGLYQLYSEYGTAALRPEKGLTLDGGADMAIGGTQLSATAFTRSVRDLIDFAFSGCAPAQIFGCYANIDRSKASGLEVEWRQAVTDSLRLSGNYSWLSTRNLSPGLQGLRLPHTPKSMGSVDIAWDATPRLNLGLGVRHVGQSFDNAFNTTVLKAYTLADLRVSYALSEAVSLYGRIENAGDTLYQTAGGYGQPGRRVWLGIHSRLF